MLRLGTMAAGVAGNMGLNAIGTLGRGERPDLRGLLLTPRNVRRVTDELARMRGAAMKVGQLLSLDTGELLPDELRQIMARLRAEAEFMPPAQLRKVLAASWGQDWLARFARFDPRPIAAASIGQVHRAVLKSGEAVAIKVQYPGVADSIDSDVANVGALIRLSGLVPKGLDLRPILEEARLQLHEETDYVAEAEHLNTFAGLLQDDNRFRLPKLIEELSGPTVMTMSFERGAHIETAASLPEKDRNHIATSLIDLCLKEIFDFRLCQTDPNFANYLFDAETSQIVLLDFGATRRVPDEIATAYAALIRAGLNGDEATAAAAAKQLGLLPDDITAHHRTEILSMMAQSFDHLRGGDIDFSDRTFASRMQERGMALAQDGFLPTPPPGDVLFIQRKLAGVYLAAAQLGAKLDVSALIARYV